MTDEEFYEAKTRIKEASEKYKHVDFGKLAEEAIDKAELDAARERVRKSSPMNPFHSLIEKQQAKHAELLEKYGKDYGQIARRFSLNIAEAAVVDAWYESLKPEILAKQEKTYDTISPGEPYYGAVGGGLTYSFIPTGLGNIIIVKETITGKELNVSDALDWFFYG